MAERNKGAAKPSNYGYSEYHPRIWHGMTLLPWLKLIGKSIHKVSFRRIPLAISVTIAATINSVLALIVKLLFRKKIASVTFEEPPIFIIGHWRSGTTWLNELLIRDPRHGYPENFHTFTPEVFLLTHKFSRIIDWFIPKSRPMDKVKISMSRPQEDEFAILGLGLETPYRYMAFPTFGTGMDRTNQFWPADAAREKKWVTKWTKFIRSVQYLHPNKRLILKSPPHTARIALLKKQFPEAKFIHICREPGALFASSMKMNKAMAATQGFEVDLQSDEQMHTGVLRIHNHMYKAFYRDVKKLGPADICYVKYEEMRANPLAQMKKIYDKLELGGFNSVRKLFENEIGQTRDFVPDEYILKPNVAERINLEWAMYFEEFGYRKLNSTAINEKSSLTDA